MATSDLKLDLTSSPDWSAERKSGSYRDWAATDWGSQKLSERTGRSGHGEYTMKITELLIAELDREAVGIRKTLERVPEGKNDWKPHEKSMPLGYLATIVATIPAWLDMVVNMDELDINPVGGSKFRPQEWKTRNDLLQQF